MSKVLIVCYSYSGNSLKIADYVKDITGGDLLELKPKVPFSNDYDEVVEEWQNNDIKRDVEIEKITIDIKDYQKIVLITCVWWYGIAPVMKRFLKEYDLAGKDIIVAASNAGWIGHAFKDYDNLLNNSNIKGYLDLVFSSGEDRSLLKTEYKDINEWINKLEE